MKSPPDLRHTPIHPIQYHGTHDRSRRIFALELCVLCQSFYLWISPVNLKNSVDRIYDTKHGKASNNWDFANGGIFLVAGCMTLCGITHNKFRLHCRKSHTGTVPKLTILKYIKIHTLSWLATQISQISCFVKSCFVSNSKYHQNLV